jgi:tetratricopeptide (TPR) repeat protein
MATALAAVAGAIAVAGAAAGCAAKEDPGAAAAGANAARRDQLAGAYQAFDERRYDDAIAAAERVLTEDATGPGSAEALYLEGRVHEQQAVQAGTTGGAKDHLREAKGLYQRVLATTPPQPLDAYARAGLANVSYFLEDYNTAAREWAAAYPHISEVGAKAWVAYRAGLSEQRRGNFAAADRHFAEVQQLFPGSEQARRAAAHQGATGFHVQVGAFATPANAQNAISALKSQGFTPATLTDAQGRQVVGVGPVQTYAQAKTLRDRLAAQYPGAVIVP